MKLPSVKKSVKRLCRREITETINQPSTSYSLLIDRLLARDLTTLPKGGKPYWVALIGAVSEGIRYGWHRGALAAEMPNVKRLTIDESFDRAEKWLVCQAVIIGARIGLKAREPKL